MINIEGIRVLRPSPRHSSSFKSTKLFLSPRATCVRQSIRPPAMPPTGPTRPQRDDKLTNYRSYLQQRLFRPLSPPFLTWAPVQTSYLKCRFPYLPSREAFSFGASNVTSLDSFEIIANFEGKIPKPRLRGQGLLPSAIAGQSAV